MSGLYFSASFQVEAAHPVYALLTPLLTLRQAEGRAEHEQLLNQLKQSGVPSALVDLFNDYSADLLADGDCTLLQIDAGSRAALEAFDHLVELLDEAGVEQYHASLFDSSSGGRQVWDKPEKDIEFDEAKVFLMGEFDDEDEVKETLEGMGAEFADSLEACTLVVVGENADAVILARAEKQGLTLLPADEVDDYVI